MKALQGPDGGCYEGHPHARRCHAEIGAMRDGTCMDVLGAMERSAPETGQHLSRQPSAPQGGVRAQATLPCLPKVRPNSAATTCNEARSNKALTRLGQYSMTSTLPSCLAHPAQPSPRPLDKPSTPLACLPNGVFGISSGGIELGAPRVGRGSSQRGTLPGRFRTRRSYLVTCTHHPRGICGPMMQCQDAVLYVTPDRTEDL